MCVSRSDIDLPHHSIVPRSLVRASIARRVVLHHAGSVQSTGLLQWWRRHRNDGGWSWLAYARLIGVRRAGPARHIVARSADTFDASGDE